MGQISRQRTKAYLVDAIPASPLDSVVGLPPALDLVEGRFGINWFLIQDVDTPDIVGLARLKLIRGVFPQHIIQFKRHSLASVVATRPCRPADRCCCGGIRGYCRY